MESLDADLVRGSIDLMVLSVLANGPKYGYLIQQRLRETSREMIDLKAGTVYPILHRLEQEKFVRSRWEATTGRRRKWYELTAAGRRQLEHRAQQWNEYVACIQRILAIGSPPVAEANA